MRPLLFDHNLSPRLVKRLADVYPHSTHVSEVGLSEADDRTVWEYARQHEFMIVTKDVDFGELLLLNGYPPKILWIRRGNCSTSDIERLLRDQLDAIVSLNDDANSGILVLY